MYYNPVITRCSPVLQINKIVPTAADVDDGAVAELDCAADGRVDLGERRAVPNHVVGRACVQIPHATAGAALVSKIHLNRVLDKVDRRGVHVVGAAIKQAADVGHR